MASIRIVAGVAVVLGAFGATSAAGQANVPSPDWSTFDDQVGVSPSNLAAPEWCRYSFNGVLRNPLGYPIQNFDRHRMFLDFSACQNQPQRPGNQFPADGETDAEGRMRWEISLAFGGADPCSVRVVVDNVTFKTLHPHQGLPCPEQDGGVRSPDQDGNGRITLTDFIIFKNQFNQVGDCMDYQGDLAQPFDGLVTMLDLTSFSCHFNAL